MVGHLKPVLWIRYKHIKYTRGEDKVRYVDLYADMPNCAKEGDRRSGLTEVFRSFSLFHSSHCCPFIFILIRLKFFSFRNVGYMFLIYTMFLIAYRTVEPDVLVIQQPTKHWI